MIAVSHHSKNDIYLFQAQLVTRGSHLESAYNCQFQY